jgi:hypothetical protein
MSSTLMMERTGMGVPGMGIPALGSQTMGAQPGAQVGTNWMMVPRCTFKVEKCQGGVKFTCQCDDKMAASMVQNLCQMLAGGLCSCCVQCNGMTVCCYNFTTGQCRCEATDSGVCFTCTSGDPEWCKMIQSCGDCISSCLECGCTCCFLMNNTPVCCGYSDSGKGSSKKGGR